MGERLRLAVWAAAQTAWTGLRRALSAALGEERLSRWLDASGLRALKSRQARFERTLPDGNRLLHRPQDQCVIDEVYAEALYLRPGQLAPGAVVVDCGGHIGVFTLQAARQAGPSGRVVVVEPSPQNLALLRRNLERNGLADVRVHACALAESEGCVTLYEANSASANPVANTLFPTPGFRPVAARARRLDDVAAEEELTHVDLLKIDVEGAELRLLDGASRVLAMTRRLVMEIHPARVDPEAVRARLRSAGFSLRTLSEKPLVVEGARNG